MLEIAPLSSIDALSPRPSYAGLLIPTAGDGLNGLPSGWRGTGLGVLVTHRGELTKKAIHEIAERLGDELARHPAPEPPAYLRAPAPYRGCLRAAGDGWEVEYDAATGRYEVHVGGKPVVVVGRRLDGHEMEIALNG